ncbi:MAG: hypothetical protein RRC34_02050 [Lentisphaeria bacterium]|nr:hypothetical protein [Lentisphaeria bacterium]
MPDQIERCRFFLKDTVRMMTDFSAVLVAEDEISDCGIIFCHHLPIIIFITE